MTLKAEPEAVDIVVTIDDDVPAEVWSRIALQIETVVRDHLSRARTDGYNFFDARLNMTVDRFLLNEETARIRIGMRGHINGIAVEHSFERTRQRHPAKFATHGLGSLVVVPIALILERALRWIAGHRIAEDQLDECLAECLADVCVALDEIAWRPDSPLVSRWQMLQRLRWCVAATAFVGEMLALRAVHPNATIGLYVLYACFAAVLAFFVMHATGILLMPAAFFHEEARGRKAMARSGAKSTLGLRVLAILTAIVFLGLLGLVVLASLIDR